MAVFSIIVTFLLKVTHGFIVHSGKLFSLKLLNSRALWLVQKEAVGRKWAHSAVAEKSQTMRLQTKGSWGHALLSSHGCKDKKHEKSKHTFLARVPLVLKSIRQSLLKNHEILKSRLSFWLRLCKAKEKEWNQGSWCSIVAWWGWYQGLSYVLESTKMAQSKKIYTMVSEYNAILSFCRCVWQ